MPLLQGGFADTLNDLRSKVEEMRPGIIGGGDGDSGATGILGIQRPNILGNLLGGTQMKKVPMGKEPTGAPAEKKPKEATLAPGQRGASF